MGRRTKARAANVRAASVTPAESESGVFPLNLLRARSPRPVCRECLASIVATANVWPSGVLRSIGFVCSVDPLHPQ